jgi:chorismate mutase
MESSIDDWRMKIDEVDRVLVALLNKRAMYADEIGKIKQKLGLPAYSPQREQEVLDNIMKNNPGPLSDLALRRLFERIIDESRSNEREAMAARQNGEQK